MLCSGSRREFRREAVSFDSQKVPSQRSHASFSRGGSYEQSLGPSAQNHVERDSSKVDPAEQRCRRRLVARRGIFLQVHVREQPRKRTAILEESSGRLNQRPQVFALQESGIRALPRHSCGGCEKSRTQSKKKECYSKEKTQEKELGLHLVLYDLALNT